MFCYIEILFLNTNTGIKKTVCYIEGSLLGTSLPRGYHVWSSNRTTVARHEGSRKKYEHEQGRKKHTNKQTNSSTLP